MKTIFFIYKLTTPSGKVYVGQTRNINRRFSAYRNLQCKDQKKLYCAIKSHGWDNLKKEILFDGSCTQEQINDKENYYISLLFQSELSLNTSEFAYNFNHKKGALNSFSKPIYQLGKDLEIINKWSSASEASQQLKISQSTISKACRLNTYYAVNYFWCFVGDYDKEQIKIQLKKPHPSSKAVVQLSLNGELIKTWNSASEVQKALGFNKNNISRNIIGLGLSAHGFIWVRKSEYDSGSHIYSYRIKKEGKNISVFDLNKNLINNYPSIISASNDLSIDKTTIHKGLKGKIKFPKKYIFKYNNITPNERSLLVGKVAIDNA